MSSLDSTSSQLGSYLLRGWTLLDQTCQSCFTPMVRSPAPDRQLLCVRCNRDTTIPLPNGVPVSPTRPADDNRPPAGYHPFVNGDDMESDEDELDVGGMQVDTTARPQETSQIDLARRAQSDQASKLIGEKLLQGYCLLDEICSTNTCFGVPLLRLPRETERRLCVICQKIYPEVVLQQPASVILQPPVTTLPSMQTIQQSLQQTSTSSTSVGEDSKDLVDRAYRTLAAELVRLTETLATYDTRSTTYDECLARVSRIVDTMQMMRK